MEDCFSECCVFSGSPLCAGSIKVQKRFTAYVFLCLCVCVCVCVCKCARAFFHLKYLTIKFYTYNVYVK